jgi:hypothetical protein
MAAAYALRGRSMMVALVERNEMLGGTATAGWVDTWIEGIHPPYFEPLFTALKAKGKANGDLDKSLLPARYTQGADANASFGLLLEHDALAAKYAEDMAAAPNITLLTGYELLPDTVEKCGGTVSAITVRPVDAKRNTYRIAARWFIDSSADGVLCRAAGCEARLGEDRYEDFGEPLMRGKTQQLSLNEPSLFFKIANTPLHDVPPNDNFNYDGYLMDSMEVNPMNGLQLSGVEVAHKGAAPTRQTAKALTPYFWDYLKRHRSEHKDVPYSPAYLNCYSPQTYAPMLGVRETWRIVCDYMLRQQDLTERISSAKLKDYIACGSHTIDFHVYGSLSYGDVQSANARLQPSGIPYASLLPKALNNVWIACRAYGASHIALAARRVNKDMAQLGWAAGHAARTGCEDKLSNTREVDAAKLQGDGYTGFAQSVRTLEKRMRRDSPCRKA